MIVRGILFIVFFFCITISLGDAFLRFLHRSRNICSSLVWGTAIAFAALQIVAYPIYRASGSFYLFFMLYSIVLLVLFSLSVLTMVREKDFSGYSSDWHSLIKGIHEAPFLFLVCAGVLLFLCLYTFAFYYPTTDDGYYMTRSMEAIRQNTLGINVRFAWLGWSEGELPDFTDASTFAFFVSYCSFLSGIQATVLSKTFMAFCLLVLHIASVLYACDTVIENRDHVFSKKTAAVILYTAFQILSVKQSSAGIWMTGYIWNGKSLLPGYIFPLLLANCFVLMRRVETLQNREWISVTVVLLAGIAVSIVGLNLPVVLYFTLGLSFLIVNKFKYFGKIWKGALLSVAPAILFAVLSYTFVITGQNDYYESGTTTPIIWADQFLEAIDFFQFVLYLLSCAYILFFGSKLQKALLILAPALLLVTFLNPFFTGFVCAYVTTSLVYWRLWWLFPVYLIPSIVIADLFNRLTKGRIQNGFICSLLSLFIVSGFEIFRYVITDPDYSILPYAENIGRLINVRPEFRYNIYGINPATYETAVAVESDWDGEDQPRMIMFFNRPFEIRQYSTDIIMAVAIRDIQLSQDIIPGTDISEYDFMKTYSEIDDGKLLRDILDQLDIDYICFDGSSAVNNLEDYGFVHLQNVGGIDLWRVVH